MTAPATFARRTARRVVPARVRDRWDTARFAPLLVLGGALLVELCLALVFVQGGWFGGDGLHYLTRRGTIPDENIGLFEPWGGHWQTVPILIYRALFIVFGLRYYLPYVLLVIVVHLAMCLLLYLLLVRAGASRWISVAAVWLLVFFGAGGEAFLSDGPLPLNLALLIGLSTLYLGLRRGLSPRALLVMPVVLVLGVMTSVAGFLVLIPIAMVLSFERGWRTAARVVVPPAVVFLVWFAIQGRDGNRVHVGGWSFFDIPSFVWTGMTAPLGSALGIPGSGTALLIVAVVAPLVVRDVPPGLRRLAWAGLALAFAQMTLSSLASMQFGVSQAQVGRYQYIVLVGLLPGVAVALGALLDLVRQAVVDVASRRLVAVIGVGILFAATLNGIALQHGQSQFMKVQGKAYRSLAFGVIAAVDDGERPITHEIDVAPLADPDDFALLARPEMRKTLPPHRTTPQERVSAESDLFVGVSLKTFDLAAPGRIDSTSFNQTIVAGSACSTYNATSFSPSLIMQTGPGAQIVVTSQSDSVTTRLLRDGVGSDPRKWGAVKGAPIVIGSTAKDAELAVAFDAGGSYTICT